MQTSFRVRHLGETNFFTWNFIGNIGFDSGMSLSCPGLSFTPSHDHVIIGVVIAVVVDDHVTVVVAVIAADVQVGPPVSLVPIVDAVLFLCNSYSYLFCWKMF